MVIDVRHILIACEFSDGNEVKDEGGQGKREVGDEGHGGGRGENNLGKKREWARKILRARRFKKRGRR